MCRVNTLLKKTQIINRRKLGSKPHLLNFSKRVAPWTATPVRMLAVSREALAKSNAECTRLADAKRAESDIGFHFGDGSFIALPTVLLHQLAPSLRCRTISCIFLPSYLYHLCRVAYPAGRHMGMLKFGDYVPTRNLVSSMYLLHSRLPPQGFTIRIKAIFHPQSEGKPLTRKVNTCRTRCECFCLLCPMYR
ncbi:hypothetical protein P691DRAFT_232117 [Macrolepiota fuliginosa MF-IS2]|uniref:Uncharacterized protein n=1 Tax=Macrolepiota fuliginosa MF-IS2 TaxID=1400762 RepID=A0A9P5X9W1_9AGAR|nr:hypothetical protein P691DRAFT_232117 [Macrolepiota fuliginosa MF-IS2]